MRALSGNCIFHFDFLVDDHTHRLTNTIIVESFDTTTNRSYYRIETVSNNNFAWYVPEIYLDI